MDISLAIAKAILAAVFAVAGVAKLRHLDGFRGAVDAFGAPGWVRPAIIRVVPLAEVAIAAGVLVPRTERLAAVAALWLLALFTIVIGVSLVRGRRPDCRCFGQVHARPIGPATLARNGMLIGIAAWVAAAGDGEPRAGVVAALSQITGLGPPWVVAASVAGTVIAAQALLQWNLLQQHGRLLLRLDTLERVTGATGGTPAMNRLPVGAPAPAFDLPSSSGNAVSLASLLDAGHPLLLIFSDPDCHACEEFLPTVAAWQAHHRSQLRIAVVSRATDARATAIGLDTVLLQRDREVADAYGIPATPAGLVIRADGNVGSAVMLGGEAIATLIPDAGTGAGEGQTSHQRTAHE